MGTLITYMFAAIAISALCSLLESVLLSTPQTYITTIENKTVDKIAENKDSAISAILIINTIANTIATITDITFFIITIVYFCKITHILAIWQIFDYIIICWRQFF